MFERFTDRARRVVVLAQEEATRLGHDYIGTEHVLLGLVEESEGLAAKVLESLGLSLQVVRDRVEEAVGRGDSTPSGHLPFTPGAKKVLELSLREALELGHNYIGTEHILLGVIRAGEGLGADVLGDLGVDLPRTRQMVIQLLAGMPREGSPTVFLTKMLGRSVTSAGGDARERGHERAGTEHLLLWLLGQPESGARRALEAQEVDLEALRSRLEGLLEEGSGSTEP